MPTAQALAVPTGISRRIEKLARDAGRTPAQMLKFVLRDGLEHTEYAVREANAGLAELDAGKGVPLADVKRRTASEWLNRHDKPQWPDEVLAFKGMADMPPFEADRNGLTPPAADLLA